MKKVAIMTVLMLVALSGYAFAATLASGGITTTDGMSIYGGVDQADADRDGAVLLGKTSKGVKFSANFDVDGFAAATKHISGTKAYGTAHNSTAIYFQDVGQTADIPELTDPNNASFGAAWTTM